MEETQLFHREDYYWASIAAEIRRSWVKDKKQVKMTDFLIDFKLKKKTSGKDVVANTNLSKQFWLAKVGYKGKRK